MEANGDRHMKRAAEWLTLGFPDYARGSLRKAAKNYARAFAMRDIYGQLLPPLEVIVENLEKELSKAMAREFIPNR